MFISPGPHTFTPENLYSIWRDGLQPCPAFPKRGDARRQCETFYCDYFHWGDDQLPQASEDHPATHFSVIDNNFSSIVVCQYQASKLDPTINEDVAVQNAVKLLTRLPSVPPRSPLESTSSKELCLNRMV
ncbi:hypothetical protein MMC14_005601 [Varicellaria rhodocarpa]|nr:hypothetical protein [Varicellaria rhodocarpa]